MCYSTAKHILETLDRGGVPVPGGARVLDFGCGEGGLVYEFRDLGFDAYGFDLHERVKYRSDNDRKYFGFAAEASSDTSDFTVAPSYGMPFHDDFFDIVVSTSVIEHIMDLPRANEEIARVLKPSGSAMHTYPHILTPIEPHLYIPYGGLIRSKIWSHIWSYIGVRNEFYEGKDAKTTAEACWRYYRTGLVYHSRSELHRIIGKDFAIVTDLTGQWQHAYREPPLWKLILSARGQRYPLRHIARQIPLHAVLGSAKRSKIAV